MTGYVRTDTTNNIADGNVISAADLDNEFNGVQAAFNSSTGHTHDGSSAEGAPITKLGPAQDVTISTTVLGVKTTNTVDLGTSSLKFKDFYLAGNASIGGTLTYGGVTLSNAVTGTGSMVLSASPTITGTITAAAANFSGAVALNGNATIGDADTDTITQAASYVTGTQLKSAKTATNTLSLAAYDVDGTAYTNLITLTASNTPTLALTSTGVGTINNMSIGATTASTGAFTTLSANSTVTLSGGTANGVAYLNGSKVLSTSSALVFDGTNLGVGSASLSSASGRVDVTINGTSSSMVSFGTGGTRRGYMIHDGTDLTTANEQAAGALRWVTSAGEAMRIATATGGVNAVGIGYLTLTSVGNNGLAVLGNVGIGTSSPVYQTQIYGSGQTTSNLTDAGNKGGSLLLNTPTVSAGDGGALLFGAGGTGAKPFSAIKGLLVDGGGNTTGALAFSTRNATADTALTERMRIDSSGTLCIGTTSPLSSVFKTNIENGRLGVSANSDQYALYLRYNTSTLGVYIGSPSANALAFSSSAGAEYMRIDSSGNLGIGTTSPLSKLSVAQGADGFDQGITLSRAGANRGTIFLNASNDTLNFGRSTATSMSLDASGNLNATTSNATSSHKLSKGSANGRLQLQVGESYPVNFYEGNGYGFSSAATLIEVSVNTVTSRSISAGGTINASGADYAEYMTKAGNFTIAKGDVVGIDAQGKLTNVFANAVSFVVKSTDPSYVGGDTWGSVDVLGQRPNEDATQEVKDAFNAALEAARQTVDRIAFSGQVPVNVTGATAGQYIIPVNNNGAIKGEAVSNPTFEQYQTAVGKVIAIESDGRAKIIVKVA